MSGSNSSAPGSSDAPEGAAGLSFTVHSMPVAALDERRTKHGRLKMLLVLLVCAAPVIASYFTYFVIRPEGRTNYSELLQPARPVPAELQLADLQGQAVLPSSLKGQWLLVVVAGAVAYLTGMGAGYAFFAINPRTFVNLSLVDPGDVTVGIAKCLAYGAAIPIVSAHAGLTTFGGSAGVGAATTRAVVNSSLSVIALDFLISGLGYLVFK